MNKLYPYILAFAALVSVGNLFFDVKIESQLSGQKGLGAFVSSGSNFTDVAVSNDVTVGNNLTVTGNTILTGNTTLTGTSTIATTANQPYFITAAFSGATTTNVGVQYTGPTVAVDAVYADFDGATSANTVNTAWRAYISKAVADGNTNATGTLMKQVSIASSSLQIAYGGPVPSSYYTASSSQFTGISTWTTTTPIMMYNGDFYNMTSTAISSSTGKFKLLVHQY